MGYQPEGQDPKSYVTEGGAGARNLDDLTPEQRLYFEERAAIREYEGGFSREKAERLAWEDLTKWFDDLAT